MSKPSRMSYPAGGRPSGASLRCGWVRPALAGAALLVLAGCQGREPGQPDAGEVARLTLNLPGTPLDPERVSGQGPSAGSGLRAAGPLEDRAEEKTTASNARAVQITLDTQLIGGEAAQGRKDDFLISNDYVRAIIQKVGREAGVGPFGGTLIDADIVRPSGEPGNDRLGEVLPFINLALTANFNSVSITDSGSTSGKAVVRACGNSTMYDFIDLNAILDEYPEMGLLIPYNFNEMISLQVCTNYSLGPNDKAIHIETTYVNTGNEDLAIPLGDIVDSGGDVEVFMPNPTGEDYGAGEYTYEYGGFGAQAYAPMDYLSFVGKGVSYAYVPPRSSLGRVDAAQVAAAGISIAVLGTTRVMKVLRGKERFLIDIPAGGSATVARDLVVGASQSEVLDTIHALRKTSTGRLSGTVTEDSTGIPLAGVRVSVLAEGKIDAPVAQFITDASGKFSGSLPTGSYGLIAAQAFDFMDDGRPQLQTPISVSITAGGSASKSLTLPRTGRISLEVLDGVSGARLPARALFIGKDNTPTISALMDVTDDHLGDNGLVRMVFLTQGAADVAVKPGTYDVVFTRGFEYDVHVAKGVSVLAGATATVRGTLTRVIDTTGYLSSDVHVHMVNSPDSPVSLERRVASFLAEGVEVLVATDHDVITNLRPTIEQLQVQSGITSIIGEEVSTFNTGHFNLFPVLYDSSQPSGGAIDWTDVSANCEKWPGTDPVYNNLTVPQIFDTAELCIAEGASLAKQVNHPRGSFQGYFGRLGLDLSKLGTTAETSADPASFRMPPGSDLFEPDGFNVIEVMNGGSIAKAATVMNDWFGFLHYGYQKASTAVSDTHTEVLQPAGYGRTWISSSTDSVLTAHNNTAYGQELAARLSAGRATSGIGAFVTTQVTNASGGSASMGELVSASSGAATLKVRVQSPEWVTYERVDIYVNPVVYANSDEVTYNDFASITPTFTYCNSLYDDGSCRNLSSYTATFTPTSVTVPSSNTAARRRDAALTIPLQLSRDSWVVAVAWDGTTRPYGSYGDNTGGFSNPIYIDTNQNGQFDAPCADYVGRECPFVLPASKRPDGIASLDALEDHHLEELRTLSEVVHVAWATEVR